MNFVVCELYLNISQFKYGPYIRHYQEIIIILISATILLRSYKAMSPLRRCKLGSVSEMTRCLRDALEQLSKKRQKTIRKKTKILTVALGNKYMWVQYTFLSAFVCV